MTKKTGSRRGPIRPFFLISALSIFFPCPRWRPHAPAPSGDDIFEVLLLEIREGEGLLTIRLRVFGFSLRLTSALARSIFVTLSVYLPGHLALALRGISLRGGIESRINPVLAAENEGQPARLALVKKLFTN